MCVLDLKLDDCLISTLTWILITSYEYLWVLLFLLIEILIDCLVSWIWINIVTWFIIFKHLITLRLIHDLYSWCLGLNLKYYNDTSNKIYSISSFIAVSSSKFILTVKFSHCLRLSLIFFILITYTFSLSLCDSHVYEFEKYKANKI